MKISGIYKITSPSKRIYIGKSADIIKRQNQYRNLKCKSQTYLYRSFIKYGFDRHKFEVICQCDESELNNLEKYYIALFQCFNSEYGLNLRSGGEGGNHSDLTKQKIRESPTSAEKRFKNGNIPWHKGRIGVYSEETLNKMRGNKNGMGNKGRRNSEEVLKLMKEIQKETYKNGKVPWNKGKKIGSASSTSFKESHIPWNKDLKMDTKHCEKLRQAQLKSYALRKLKESISVN